MPELHEAGADEPRHQRLPGGGIGDAGGGQPLRLLELAQGGFGGGAEAAVGGAGEIARPLQPELQKLHVGAAAAGFQFIHK